MYLQPLAKRVVICYPEAKEMSDGGIILAGQAIEESRVGSVHYVGKDVEEIKVRDDVVTSGYAGDKVELEGIQYHIVKEEDVMAIVKG